MSGIVAVQRSIRRALYGPLYTAVKTAGLLLPNGDPVVKWGPSPFERDGLPSYYAAAVGFGRVVIHEIGATPLVEGSGVLSIVAHSPLKLEEDGNDALTGIIVPAYPYASTVSFAGVDVFVDKMEPGGYGSDGPWMTGLTRVYWNVYRRP